MSNVIGRQHHTINVVNAQMTHLQHLLHHLNNNDRYQLGDHVTIIGNNPPSTFIIEKGIRPINTDSDTESDESSSDEDDMSEDDDDSIVGIDPRLANNAATPIPTSGLQLGSLGQRRAPHVIERGGAKRTRKGKRKCAKHRRTAKRRRNNTSRGCTSRN